MKLKPIAMGLALGLVCALYVVLVTYYPMITEAILGKAHGISIRSFMQDLYPYYTHANWYGVLIGIIYGFIDGFLFGLITAGLYNGLLCEDKKKKKKKK